MTTLAVVVEVASTSTPGKSYRVWVGEDGPIFCECPASRFARGKVGADRKPCKHMRAMGASTVLPAAMALAGGQSPKAAHWDAGFRFIELQEETTEGSWVPVTDLRRFNNLEV